MARDLFLEVAGRRLLQGGNFVVGRRDKVGLVGRNGAGKSSLLSVVLGQAGPHVRHGGEVTLTGTVGFLPQVPVPGGQGTEPNGLSHVLSARGLDVLDHALQEARRQMADEPTAERIERFTGLEERFRTAGGYEVEGEVARLADGLGLDQGALVESLSELSGGQRRRLDLIRVLFARPDVMVLDEPTNHLDVAAKRWLLGELARFPNALLLVSHDIGLLDSAITKVLDLSHGELQEHRGTYSSFRAQQAADLARQQTTAIRQDREIRRLSGLADSMRHSTASRARTAKVLDRRAERLMANRVGPVRKERRATFKLPAPERSGATPLVVHSLSVSYGDHKVLLDVDLSVGRGERVAVVGRNGVGKSSLLRCLAGHQAPSGGSVEIGYRVSLGYFAQEHEQLELDRSGLDHLAEHRSLSDADRRSLLGSFGLTGDTAMQPAGSLSGGERAKLSLALLAAGQCNLLVLDEPTNNLDPSSMEAVGAMLAVWPGTVVAVSHDRPFVEQLQPTHALHLPQERYDLWRPEHLDDVEVR